MLRACRRVLKPEGRLAFFTLAVQPGISSADGARLERLGGRGVFADSSYTELLVAAGFTIIRARDVTRTLRATLTRLVAEREKQAAALRRIEGVTGSDADTAYLRNRLLALNERLIQRWLYVARPAAG